MVYTITYFLKEQFETVMDRVRPMRFVAGKGEVCWKADGRYFSIRPFAKEQGAYQEAYGYRSSFSMSTDGAIYLFDSSVGLMKPTITSIECELTIEEKDFKKGLKEVGKVKILDPKGIYVKDGISIIRIPRSNRVILQTRAPRGKSLKLIDTVDEIEKIKESMNPNKIDIFTFLEEQTA